MDTVNKKYKFNLVLSFAIKNFEVQTFWTFKFKLKKFDPTLTVELSIVSSGTIGQPIPAVTISFAITRRCPMY